MLDASEVKLKDEDRQIDVVRLLERADAWLFENAVRGRATPSHHTFIGVIRRCVVAEHELAKLNPEYLSGDE